MKRTSKTNVGSVYEDAYYQLGRVFIAGSDECGRGCLAGPVAAAAVILPRGCEIAGLNDSKRLSPKAREALFPIILDRALAVGHALVDACVIDRINIHKASLRVIGEALLDLPIKPDIALIDGLFLPDISIEMEAVKGGDGLSVSIAAASVVTKVMRDRLMLEYAREYPEYGFDRHKGYGTKAHYEALRIYGPCPIHRRSFRLSH